MTFQEAADALSAARITNQDIADACGVSRNAIERARMTGTHSRTPPPNWPEALARLAAERASHLHQIIADLRK